MSSIHKYGYVETTEAKDFLKVTRSSGGFGSEKKEYSKDGIGTHDSNLKGTGKYVSQIGILREMLKRERKKLKSSKFGENTHPPVKTKKYFFLPHIQLKCYVRNKKKLTKKLYF